MKGMRPMKRRKRQLTISEKRLNARKRELRTGRANRKPLNAKTEKAMALRRKRKRLLSDHIADQRRKW